MKKRVRQLNITCEFADGTVMSEEELLRNGRIIRPENNIEVQLEARRIFYPEYAEEARKIAKYERAEKRRQELMAEYFATYDGVK